MSDDDLEGDDCPLCDGCGEVEAASLQDVGCVPCPDCVSRELRGKIMELERDARRYRYLRERDLDTIHRGGVFAGRIPQNVVVNGDDLDAAIDAAMSGNQ